MRRRDQPPVIDPLFLKSEDEILTGILTRELDKCGFDMSVHKLLRWKQRKTKVCKVGWKFSPQCKHIEARCH